VLPQRGAVQASVRRVAACAGTRCSTLVASLAIASGLGLCAPPALAHDALPAPVQQALAAARVSPNALSVLVQPIDRPTDAPRLQWQPDTPRNPASLFKLVTTSAALDLLGPAFHWTTPVWLDGPLDDPGVLHGSLAIRGSGDPTLVLERVWLLLRRVRQLGVAEIDGDIVLDRSAFAPAAGRAGDFDGEPLEPYNVQPDALLLNYGALLYTFTPDPERGVARISVDPPLAGLAVPASVPLADGPCADWHAALRASFVDPQQVRFAGAYPQRCGERQWPVAAGDAADYDARVVEALWRELGGRLRGRVRDGLAPADRPPSFELASPPLGEVVRTINKFSNNVMAEQLFLTLAGSAQQDLVQRAGAASEAADAARGADAASAPTDASAAASPSALAQPPATPAAAREVLRAWLRARLGTPLAETAVIDNGAGLSRQTRVSAQLLGALLQRDWALPTMPELVASLPITGEDGTLQHSQAPRGCAHLKTGTLRDSAGVAGYVLGDSGRRYVLVAMINDPRASAARGALDALVAWACHDLPAERGTDPR
jgi:D-alanyl-D-alanine carboxypeptidase/D-alanyl-D-alanine-endopeptidase (penicillin-binding protein 4)